MAENVEKASQALGKSQVLNHDMIENYSQIDNLMSECEGQVQELIGKIRETRKTRQKIKVPIAYSNSKLLGERLSKKWLQQVETNESLARVVAMN